MKAVLTLETEGPLGVSVILNSIEMAFRSRGLHRGHSVPKNGRGEYEPGAGAWPVVKVKWEVTP